MLAKPSCMNGKAKETLRPKGAQAGETRVLLLEDPYGLLGRVRETTVFLDVRKQEEVTL
jgi:hypothetical protein